MALPPPYISDEPVLPSDTIKLQRYNDTDYIYGVEQLLGNFGPNQGSIANIMSFGAVGDGLTDDTIAIQAALNSGAQVVYVPPTRHSYVFTTLILPALFGFTLLGNGSGSLLKQTGAGIKWPVNLDLGYYEAYVKNLGFNGNLGTGHTIDTSYSGGTTLQNLYFTDTPIGFDSIHIDGSSTTYTHDVRCLNILIYTNTHGHAGIGFGAHAADADISDFNMNGNFVTDYCIYAADGAQSMTVKSSHPYNAKINVVKVDGSAVIALLWNFTGVVFDNALGDLVYLGNCHNTLFTGCTFEATHAGFNSLTLVNCDGVSLVNPCISGAFTSHYGIEEQGSTVQTIVIGGSIFPVDNFNNPPFKFLAETSFAFGVLGYTNRAQKGSLAGATTAVVTAGSTKFLGCNGAQTALINTGFPIESPTHILSASIISDAAPGTGSYTFTLYRNTSIIAGPTAVTGSVFNTILTVTPGTADPAGLGDQIAIKIVSAGGAPDSNFRYNIQYNG